MHRFFGLLAQTMPGQRGLCASFIGPQHQVVTHTVGGIQTHHTVGLQPTPFDQPLQHALAVAEHPLCFGAHHLVFQNRRKRPRQIPGLKERPPIDERL